MNEDTAHQLLIDWGEWYVRTFIDDGIGHSSKAIEVSLMEGRIDKGSLGNSGRIPKGMMVRPRIVKVHRLIWNENTPRWAMIIAVVRYVVPINETEKIKALKKDNWVKSTGHYYRLRDKLLKYVCENIDLCTA